MICFYQSRPPGKDTGRRLCAIGLYGGHPWVGECNKCMAAGQNNEKHAAELAARAARSHPASAARISGCCDRADQS